MRAVYSPFVFVERGFAVTVPVVNFDGNKFLKISLCQSDFRLTVAYARAWLHFLKDDQPDFIRCFVICICDIDNEIKGMNRPELGFGQ